MIREQTNEFSLAPKIKFGDNKISFQNMDSKTIINRFRAFKNSELKSVFFEIEIKSKLFNL